MCQRNRQVGKMTRKRIYNILHNLGVIKDMSLEQFLRVCKDYTELYNLVDESLKNINDTKKTNIIFTIIAGCN